MNRPSKSNNNFSKNVKECESNFTTKQFKRGHLLSKQDGPLNVKDKGGDVMAVKNNNKFKKKFKGNASDLNPKHSTKHKGSLALALEEYKSKKLEEQKRKEENKNKKEEMNKALQQYKEKKAQKLKRLCKKTKKGQPIMKYWIEDLLEKIQNTS